MAEGMNEILEVAFQCGGMEVPKSLWPEAERLIQEGLPSSAMPETLGRPGGA